MSDSDEPNMQSEGPPKSFTPAERITELNDIDTTVSNLLSSAATATGILSNSPDCAPDPVPTDIADAQKHLTTAVNTFFSTLATIEVRLRRNIYALEEAGLVEAGDQKDRKRGEALSTEMTRAVPGPLDSSWLNAQADNGVEAGLRKEVLREIETFLAESKSKDSGAG